MKKLIITLLFTIIGIASYAQDTIRFDTNGGFTQVITTNANAKQEYAYIRSYFAGKTSNYKYAVQVEDAENGKIILKANKNFRVTSDKLMGRPIDYDGIEKFDITIDCKDKRFRLKIDAVRYSYNGYIIMASNGGNIKQREKIFSHENEDYYLTIQQINNIENFNEKRSEYFNKLIADLKAFIEQQKKEDDF